MKIAIVVHGRFHAFDLARALLERGHDVTLFTNYPKWAVNRFDFPTDRVRSFWLHGVLTRGVQQLQARNSIFNSEANLHTMFGRWAASEMQKEYWDVVHPWSGVSEEIFQTLKEKPTVKLLMRGSAHIAYQARLLEEEEHRTAAVQDRPSRWMIARESREYSLTDKVVVLSSFASGTFLEEGFPREKLRLLPLGSDVKAFRPSSEIVEARCRRILSGQPLRVLYVGALSFQKGLWDMMNIVRTVSIEKVRFQFVGPVSPEVNGLIAELRSLADVIPKKPQVDLPKCYAWGDLFIFPTIQDGYAQVLAQANASALPILTTTNCSGPDLLSQGQTGWVLPIRSADAFIELLRWCDAHRQELAAMVRRIYDEFKPRDWSDVAADFEKICFDSLEASRLGILGSRKLEREQAGTR
jgi:glycosyltransferase involved in cell wall biosynthesis